MHKKAFDDWAYSAPPYLAGIEGRGQGRDKKGVVRDRIHHPPYQQFLDPPLMLNVIRSVRFVFLRQPMFIVLLQRLGLSSFQGTFQLHLTFSFFCFFSECVVYSTAVS